MSNTIHPTAIIHPTAVLGSGNIVGPYAIIEEDVSIGNNNILESHCIIKKYTSIQDANSIHSFAVLGDTPQDLKFAGEKTFTRIGSNNTFREFVTVHRGTAGDKGITTIGDNNLFMAHVHIAHDCVVKNGIVLSVSATLGGHVHLDDYCIIGGFVAIHQYTRIGKYTFLAAMSGIAKDVPPFMMASDRRSVATVHGVNLVGLRRAGFNKETIHALRSISKIFWKSHGLDAQERIAEIQKSYGEYPQVQEFIVFVNSSVRGILGWNSEDM
ncbi:MAG: acyl-ACP--UDP-N-acetylglucosamine O-acyltransferase [Desulfovibrionaceae bacterium]